MQQQSVQNIVNERIASLPVLTRCVMQKYYYHDLSVSQIAYELNISPQRAAQELSKVKHMLKDVIAASYGADYMNRVRVNSLAEASIVWVAFAGILGYAASAGTAAGAVAVGAAAAGGMAAGAGGMTVGAGVGGMAAGAGGVAAGAGGMTVGAGVGGMTAGAGVGGMAAGAGGMAAGAGGMTVGAGVSGVAAGGGAVGASAAGTAGSAAVGASAAGTAGSSAVGASTAGAAVGSAAVKTGLGVGAKVAIGVVAAAAVAGGAAGVYTVLNNGDKSDKNGIYAEVNDLPFSDETDGYTSPGYVAFSDGNGNEIQIEDVEIIQHDSESSITDYTETETEDGCRILNFTIETVLPVEIYDPYSEAGSLNVSVTSFELFDYYTGLTLPTKETYGDEEIGGELEVEYEDKGYDISYTSQTYWDWGDWDFSGDGNNTREITVYCYYEVTIPDDYDGLCLFYDKSGDDHIITDDEREEIDSAELLELCDVDDIICYRLDNLRESE
jgi:hypothetical protein